jgi:hypothetical protein
MRDVFLKEIYSSSLPFTAMVLGDIEKISFLFLGEMTKTSNSPFVAKD